MCLILSIPNAAFKEKQDVLLHLTAFCYSGYSNLSEQLIWIQKERTGRQHRHLSQNLQCHLTGHSNKCYICFLFSLFVFLNNWYVNKLQNIITNFWVVCLLLTILLTVVGAAGVHTSREKTIYLIWKAAFAFTTLSWNVEPCTHLVVIRTTSLIAIDCRDCRPQTNDCVNLGAMT